jgi:hypothetical protein
VNAGLGLLVGVLASLSTVGAAPAAASPCTDCDLVIAEADLPAGYTYDAESPERDPKGTARSIRFDDCVVPEKLRREPPGVERQSAIFATEDDPLGGDENVVRFKTVKRARAFASAFDAYLLDGPKCEVVKARADDGSIFDLARLEALDLGDIGDQRAAIVSHSPVERVPDRFVAIVRTKRTVVLIEAFESEQIDRARFVQLVDDAVAAASD